MCKNENICICEKLYILCTYVCECIYVFMHTCIDLNVHRYICPYVCMVTVRTVGIGVYVYMRIYECVYAYSHMCLM